MAAEEWIQLFAHPEDAEILRMSRITKRNSFSIFCAVVRWFWHVDRKQECERTGLDDDGFHRIAQWRGRKGCPTLAEAMRDKHVQWLRLAEDGTLIVPNFEKYFGRGAKRRALEARRKLSARYADKTRTNDGQKARPTPTPTSKKTPLPPTEKPTAWDAACAAMKTDRLKTDAFREAWESWSRDRRARGLALTDEAVALQIRDMESWGPRRAIAAIELTIAKGWKGLREAEGVGDGKPTVQPGQNRQDAERIHREAVEADRRAEIVKRLYPALDQKQAKAAYAKWKAAQPGGIRKWLPDDPAKRQETVVELMRPGAIARELEENAT